MMVTSVQNRCVHDWQEVQQLQVDLLSGSSNAEDAPLPDVSRGQVFSSCFQARAAVTLGSSRSSALTVLLSSVL